MRRFFLCLFFVLLTTVFVRLPSQAQSDRMLITQGSEGFVIQSAPDAEAQIIDAHLTGDSFYRPFVSPDQRYVSQIITAPEYNALSEEELANAFGSVPQNIVLLDLQTGEQTVVAGQSEGFPDDPWIYRSPPMWSPTENQFAFVQYEGGVGSSIQRYDAESQTLTTVVERIPMGYSDAGMIGVPSVQWSSAGLFSFASNIAEDRFGFAQTLTLLDPSGETVVEQKVVGRTLSGGAESRDTVLVHASGVNAAGEPALLMATADGEWFTIVTEGFGRIWGGTPILRPAGGGDIQIIFAPVTDLNVEFPRIYFRPFIRRGAGVFLPLDFRYGPSEISHMPASVSLFPAPDGSSVIIPDGEGGYLQWFGPDDIRPIDLEGRRIIAWGEWTFQMQNSCFVRPTLSVIDGPSFAWMIREEAVDLHSALGERAEVIGAIQPGELVRVTGGPVCVDGDNWYQIALDDELSGWAVGRGLGGDVFDDNP